MRKIRFLFFEMVVIFSTMNLLITCVYAATYNDFTYYMMSNGEVQITKASSSLSGNIDIPYEIEGSPVTRIGNNAFAWCRGIEKIKIPDSVTSIGEDAFYNTGYYINDENWEDGVLYIGKYLIDGSKVLEICNVKSGTVLIGDRAFDNCHKLQEITIPGGVTNIGACAFFYCDNLKKITISDSITDIGSCAFSYCKKLTDIYYTGSEEQWNKINIAGENDCLFNATIHFAKHSHKYQAIITEATCILNGNTKFTCNCGDSYIEEITIDANAHKWDSGTITTTATCKVSGVKTYTCQHNSAHKKTEKLGVNASNHVNTKKVAAVAATTEKVGYTEGVYCNDCKKYILGHAEIPKLVPEFTDSKDAKESGSNIVSNNGLTVAQLLSQAGKGATIKTKDGKAVENAVLIGTGMVLTMADGTTKEIVVYGDADGDGKISAADARYALRASVCLETVADGSCYYKAINVDNGYITSSDARDILRTSVGLEDSKKWMK